ncbi:hypothetical protein POM88_018248 [Heracleum sosnowskyi]|uniref:Integrase catalytic domain-containing protein n=1 Tax=Heracleum sosnowskyi TaxID=360622 RepID=A0AAD8IU20_9APIA|nr:hypothetical protein POM88_018248 [Heracleum sosnowskyi]
MEIELGDHSNSQLGQIIFNGSNYVNWSRSVKLALGAKNKIGFIDGSLSRPTDDSVDLQKWIRNDYMVTGWILYSIDKDIAESFIFTPSARDLWLEIKERYGHSNAPQLYELHKNLISLEQHDDSIVVYYGKLKKIWDQLQILESFPDCSCGAMTKCTCNILNKFMEADQLKKLIQFIVGLNKSYDQTNSGYKSSHTVNGKKDFKKAKLERFCDYCKVRGHLKDQCFKLTGYPDWFKGKGIQSQSTQSSTQSSQRFAGNVNESSTGILGSSPLDAESYSVDSSQLCIGNGTPSIDPQLMSAFYKEFLKMMQGGQQPSGATTSRSAAINFADTWASDHMAIHLSMFLDIHTLDTPLQIALPDGSLKSVHIIGSIQLTHDIVLKGVFYVPDFNHNLLSVGKLLLDHHLIAIFEATSCCFQDLSTKLVKAVGFKEGSLYKLTQQPFSTTSVNSCLSFPSAFRASNHFQKPIKVIRSDNGTEIVQHFCSELFLSKGIVYQRSIPGNPQQNGRVERKHRHLLDTARALRLHVCLPVIFWGECLLTATYIINLMPSSVLNWKTPYEILMNKLPDYSFLRVVGCLCYAARKSSDKLAPRATKCVFLGYPYAQKGYKLYDLENKVILLSRDVLFKENHFPFKDYTTHNSVTSSSLPLVHYGLDDLNFESDSVFPDSVHSHASSHESPIESSRNGSHLHSPDVESPDNNSGSISLPVAVLRMSARTTHLPSKYKDFHLANLSTSQAFNVIVDPYGSFYDDHHLASLANVLSINEPNSYGQAKQDPRWVEAMDKELAALAANHTWELTALPPDKKTIGCKWFLSLNLTLMVVWRDVKPG